ncbi:GNAT family N-acetyltransferase [Staphylococcus carnosus]|uniref:GNAT family N-acetyltransferase n=1 Tax=Staphylococcus carnosus TaxID=1281 RepID=UPI00081A4AA6|nr:GNAT family N-acetyltransferase [Staphylococcus carnosus]ANZ34175.1 GNAT family acetyltransferase [Staphylococcus carnosus]UTB86362.1 GNAT family acetyltransferase [Staphylococcus carnosus]
MSTITLKPYHSKYNAEIEKLSIADKDSDYALTPLNALKDLADTEDPVLIFSDDNLAGFLRLNFNDERFGLTDNEHSVLVKSFSVTEQMQGNKIAQKALFELPNYISCHYSNIDEIILSVNFKNSKAIYVYEKCGFIDTNRVIGGPAGNQHVMSLKIQQA